MQQIYVVCAQKIGIDGFSIKPVAAYSDYPSALDYAEKIFVRNYFISSEYSARDLVFMVNLSPTPAATTTTPTTPNAA